MISFPYLKKDDIEVRVSQCSEKGAQLLLYKTARCDMRILDEYVGQESWDCSYESINGKLFCTVGVLCEQPDGRYSWVYKQDVGVESNMEPTKGEASDAFKRACFKWGIGRELYTAPFIWVPKEKLQRHQLNSKTGRWACYDRFTVRSMEVENGRITELEIENDKKLSVFKVGSKSSSADSVPDDQPRNRFEKVKALKQEAVSLGVSESGIDEWCEANIKKPKKEYSDYDIKRTETYLAGLISTMRGLDGR